MNVLRKSNAVTQGIAPKAILAAVLPTLGGLVAVLVQWLLTGEFDKAELVTALTAVATALLAFLGAWAGGPGQVVITQPAVVGPASDALLPDDVKARIDSEAGYTLVEVGLFLVLLAVAAAVVVAFVT